MLEELKQIIEIADRLTVTAVLLAWLIWEIRKNQKLTKERDKWKGLALRGTRIATRAVRNHRRGRRRR